MKKLTVVFFLFLIAHSAGAQILRPVTWSFTAQKESSNKYALHMKAIIDAGWHIYAQQAGEGPVPTSFAFDTQSSGIQLIGKTKGDGKLKKAYDRNFNSILSFYENAVDFVQLVRVKPGIKQVSGVLQFMVCNNHECLPPKEIDFTITL
jgi:Thiol:disulfide interchange protein DsbD, N-terminal